LAFFVAAKSIKAGAAGAEEARSTLMREAALGALLVHRNVVATVGICTTPRDVPALLLLAFCPESSLKELVNSASPESISVSERLTYCAQVIQGLQYISTRRIIHRDVAARNVLLDSTMTCKISDFGMATALVEDGKEYMRSTEQLAIRWCSIEVAKEGKYSSQSDVWAFGVLAYEVFACGVLPYSDQFDNLTEVSNFIKDGGKLNRPSHEACPADVYDQLMLPCFAADPAERPTFGELYDVAVNHGAEEDDEALAERTAGRNLQKASIAAAATASGADGAVDRALLGPSVHHLKETLVPGMLDALDSKWSTTLTRADAGKLLTQAQVDGGFLVRPSAKASSGLMLLRYEIGAGVKHLQIESGDGEVWLQTWQRRFANVNALIAYYMGLDSDRKVGDRVAVKGYDCIGTVRFVGDHHESGKPRIGVDLDEAIGKNSGTVGGHEYFSCPSKRGVLAAPSKISDAESFGSMLVTIPGHGAASAPAYSYESLLAGGDMAEASIWNMVHAFAKPISAESTCPRDGKTGCAYVDTLEDENEVGKADALLSYSWGYVVAEVSAALSAWAERSERNPKRTRIWICSLCLNQHRMSADVATPEELAAAFGDRVVALGRILPMLEVSGAQVDPPPP